MKPVYDIDKLRNHPWFIQWSLDNPEDAKRLERRWQKEKCDPVMRNFRIGGAIIAALLYLL